VAARGGGKSSWHLLFPQGDEARCCKIKLVTRQASLSSRSTTGRARRWRLSVAEEDQGLDCVFSCLVKVLAVISLACVVFAFVKGLDAKCTRCLGNECNHGVFQDPFPVQKRG
jgi:hypothetical protein